jgi:hypothetical protein
MSISFNEIIAEGNAYSSTTPSEGEQKVKALFDVPCIGTAISIMSLGSLQIIQATFNMLKPMLLVYAQSFSLQSAKLSIFQIQLKAGLQALNYITQSAEKVIDSLPTGVFKKCPELNKIYEGTLGFVKHTNIAAKAADLSYKLQQITSIQTEIELGKETTLNLVRRIDVFLDKVNQKIEEMSA